MILYAQFALLRERYYAINIAVIIFYGKFVSLWETG